MPMHLQNARGLRALGDEFIVFMGIPALRESPSAGRGGLPAIRLGDIATGLVPPTVALRPAWFGREPDALPRTRVGDVLVGSRGHAFSAAVVGEASAGAAVTENLLVIRHHLGAPSKRAPAPSDAALAEALAAAALAPGYLALLLSSGAALTLARAAPSGLHLLSPRDLEAWEVPLHPRPVQDAAAGVREETLRAIHSAERANTARRALLDHIAHALRSDEAASLQELG